jgi:predicted Zn-dependent protease
MKKRNILLLVLLLPLVAFAQFTNDAEEFCTARELVFRTKTRHFLGSDEFVYNYLTTQNFFTSDSASFIKYRVPVKLWIYTHRDGSGNISDEEIGVFIKDLNYFNIANKTGFRYYLQDVEYIQKNRHYKLGYFWEAPWQSFIHKDKGAINVHFAGNIKKAGGTVSGTFNQLSRSVLVKKGSTRTSLTHEIGHYFGLLHPHRYFKGNKCHQEAVSRTRKYKGCLTRKGLICETSGDKLCDTPAEPDLLKSVNKECEYTGDFEDNWGEKYVPKVNNIMSYPAYRKCRNEFTAGQVALMLYTAERNRFAPYWQTEKNGQAANIQFNFDNFEPDNAKAMASVLKEDETQYHSFHSIFKGSGKKVGKDKTDWVEISIYTHLKNDMNIKFMQGVSVFPNMEVTIFNSNNEIISTKNISKNGQSEINLKKLPVGKYYIKIEIKENHTFADYILSYTN